MTAATYTAKVGFTVPANCKVMALCDDTEETVVGAELVSNPGPTYTVTTGYVAGANCTLSVVSNLLRATSGAAGAYTYYIVINTVVGARYKVWTTVSNNSVPVSVYLRIYDSVATLIENTANTASTGDLQCDFTATTTTTALQFEATATGASQYFSIAYLKSRIVDSDISGNDIGIAVYGSIPKTAAATNATTSMYGVLSTSIYGYQPYNSALNFGTSAHYGGIWFKTSGNSAAEVFIERSYYTGGAYSGPSLQLYMHATGVIYFRISDDGLLSADDAVSPTAYDDGDPHLAMWVSDGTTIYLYVDGDLVDSTAITNAASGLTNTSASLYIGVSAAAGSAATTNKLAGFRIGTGSLTAAQIKTIYDDEKHLFKPESLFTVVGDSYDVDIPTTGHARSRNIVKSSQKSLSGRVESVKSREEVTYDVTTPPLAIAKLVEVRSLLRNVDNGETFFFDAKGSVASEYDLQECVLESESESESQANEDYQSTSFTVRVL